MANWQVEVRRRLEGARLEPAREREIAEEIGQHLEERYADLTSHGREAGAAEAAILAELDAGGLLAERLRAAVRPAPRALLPDAPPQGLLADAWRDLRYAVRMLAKNRGFTLVTLLSLALGIGVNTALFQLLVALHWRALPVAEPEELAIVKIANFNWPNGSPIARAGWHPDLTYRLWERIRDRQQAFSGALAWGERRFNTATSGEARWARTLLLSGDAFRVLGVKPLLGRFFTAEDDHRGCGEPGVVLMHGYWQREMAGDPAVIGRTLPLDGRAVRVIGVAPPSFFGLEVGRAIDVAVPLCIESAAKLDGLHDFWLSVMGRRKPGFTLDAASAHLASISSSIFEDTVPPILWPENAAAYRGFKLAAYPAETGISPVREQFTTPLFFLMGIAGFVLLIACTNLANLLLARAAAREREIAVRLALGASRGRLVRQLMVESLLLASLGAALGLSLAGPAAELLMRSFNAYVDAKSDWRVVGFTVGLAGLTAVLFGLVPALRASRSDMGLVLKASAGRSSTAGGHRFGLRRILIAAQVAFSFVLLLSALLFVRSLRNILSVDAGFRETGVLAVRVNTPRDLEDDRRTLLGHQLVDRLRAVPGIDIAAQTSIVPMGDSAWNELVWLEGSQSPQKLDCNISHVGAGYFRVLGMQLLGGRDFTDADREGAPKVAVVNEEFARRMSPGANPVGSRLRIEEGDLAGASYEIIGLARDTKYRNLREEFSPIVYLSTDQDPRVGSFPGLNLLIRSDLPLAGVTDEVKRVVAQLAPAFTMTFDPLETIVRATTLTERLMAALAGCFGVLAVALAAVGLYGVISYSVRRRTREIGIRVALGADRRRVTAMVFRETAELLGAGLVGGVVLGLLATRAAGGMLYGITPHDPVTVLMTAILMTVVAVVATLLPARRAASVEPIIALREE